ncbi:MAG: DsbA family oxidoreductase [Balneolaceae bacterium]|nr:DsbA family oxidoreductase [Balneolaceae bacterium]
MKIEIWSDIACPFCYIGKHHLERALRELEADDSAEIQWHSFELDPEAEVNLDQDIYEMLAQKYGQSLEWAKKANADMKKKAAQVGIAFNPDQIQPTNTFDAHRLVKLAETEGRANQAEERLFSAYFSEGLHVADHDVLVQLGNEVGLDPERVTTMLESGQYSDAVRADEKEARELGIRGVPFFVFNRKYAVSGAQPVHTFKEAMRKCLEDERAEAAQ